jgi:hypothetical protein
MKNIGGYSSMKNKRPFTPSYQMKYYIKILNEKNQIKLFINILIKEYMNFKKIIQFLLILFFF